MVDSDRAPYAVVLDPQPTTRPERPVDSERYSRAIERDRLDAEETLAATLAAHPTPKIVAPLPAGHGFIEDARFLLHHGLAVGFVDTDGNLIEQKGDFGERRLFVTNSLDLRIANAIGSGSFAGLCFDTRLACIVFGPDVDVKVRMEKPLFKPTMRRLRSDGMSRRFYQTPVMLEGAVRVAQFEDYTITVGQLFEPIGNGADEWVWQKLGVPQMSSTPHFIREALGVA